MYKEIIILAKSCKSGDYCIAGIDTTTGVWVRPISDDIFKEGAVPERDITYSDGNQLQILDKVRIKMLSRKPTKCQPENYIYDKTQKWIKTGLCTLDEVIQFRGYDDVDIILYNTLKDVSDNELRNEGSLLLLNIKNSYVFIKTFDDGNRKIQLNFEYNNINYKYLSISDKEVLDFYRNKPDGIYSRKDNLCVVISLTDKYVVTNKYYKMVAQLFYIGI